MTDQTQAYEIKFIFRCSKTMRAEAKAKAACRNTTLSEVIRTVLQWYIDDELEVYAGRALNAGQHGGS